MGAVHLPAGDLHPKIVAPVVGFGSPQNAAAGRLHPRRGFIQEGSSSKKGLHPRRVFIQGGECEANCTCSRYYRGLGYQRHLTKFGHSWPVVVHEECGPGLAPPILISERSDGTMIFYASPIPPGRYRDIAEGRWIGTDTVALKGILGSGFNNVKWARVSPGGLVFEDGAEWQKVPDRPVQNRP